MRCISIVSFAGWCLLATCAGNAQNSSSSSGENQSNVLPQPSANGGSSMDNTGGNSGSGSGSGSAGTQASQGTRPTNIANGANLQHHRHRSVFENPYQRLNVPFQTSRPVQGQNGRTVSGTLTWNPQYLNSQSNRITTGQQSANRQQSANGQLQLTPSNLVSLSLLFDTNGDQQLSIIELSNLAILLYGQSTNTLFSNGSGSDLAAAQAGLRGQGLQQMQMLVQIFILQALTFDLDQNLMLNRTELLLMYSQFLYGNSQQIGRVGTVGSSLLNSQNRFNNSQPVLQGGGNRLGQNRLPNGMTSGNLGRPRHGSLRPHHPHPNGNMPIGNIGTGNNSSGSLQTGATGSSPTGQPNVSPQSQLGSSQIPASGTQVGGSGVAASSTSGNAAISNFVR